MEYKSRRLPVSWYLSTSPERDLADAATFTSARRDPGAVESKVCKSPAEFLTPDTWFSLHRCRLRIKTHRTHCSHRRHSTVSKVNDGISSCKRSNSVSTITEWQRLLVGINAKLPPGEKYSENELTLKFLSGITTPESLASKAVQEISAPLGGARSFRKTVGGATEHQIR